MRYFVQQIMKRGRCGALNQYYKPTISDEVFNINSKELEIYRNTGEILVKNF